MPRKAKAKAASSKVWQPLALYDHQQEVVDAYKIEGIRRFYEVWHRRAGKDVFGLDFARERMNERIGSYWHLFPFHVQAKRAIWKGIDARTGERFINRAFPPEMIVHEDNSEMSITTKKGSTWQMLGSDNYDRLVGANVCGVVFSEWALCDPAAWDYIRPILVENKGWAMFITTFRGRNHAYRMYETLKDNPNWHVSVRTIDDTCRRDGSPIVTPEDVAKEIAEGMDPNLAQQEFYCDPAAANVGAVFMKQYARLMETDTEQWQRNNKVVRVAWGMQDEGIAAVVFQDNHVIGAHTFLEQNITDAVQIVTRRYPQTMPIHHAVNLDPSLFNSLDGDGVVTSLLANDEHMRQGHVAAMLNTCRVAPAAREVLADFAMTYTPYRDSNDDAHLTHPALAQAVAVMHSSQLYGRGKSSKPLDYSRYDRGVI